MSSAGTRTPTRTRTALRLAAGAVVVGAGVVVGVPAATGTSLGAWAGDLGGRTDTARYDVLADAPTGTLPAWLPAGTTDVTVVRPGPDADVDPTLRKVDAAVPAGWALPQGCTGDAAYSQPWDGGGSWPLTVRSAISTCPDGDRAWKAITGGGRVYAWR